MANRETLLARGGVTQEVLLIQSAKNNCKSCFGIKNEILVLYR